MHTDLWKFATHLYARPGVEAACLTLQDQGCDVCLVLCAAWLNAGKVGYAPERAVQLQQLAAGWQHAVVGPLRELRRQWRTAAQQDAALTRLREQVKALELEAERTLLERLMPRATQACIALQIASSSSPVQGSFLLYLAWKFFCSSSWQRMSERAKFTSTSGNCGGMVNPSISACFSRARSSCQ